MQANTTNIIKMIVEMVLTALLLFLMAYQATCGSPYSLNISKFKKAVYSAINDLISDHRLCIIMA